MNFFYFLNIMLVGFCTAQEELNSLIQHRSYCIERLGNIVESFTQLHKKHIKNPIFSFPFYKQNEDGSIFFVEQNVSINNDFVVACVKQIKKNKNDEQLLLFYSDLNNEAYKNTNLDLERDFALLLYCFYDHILRLTLKKNDVFFTYKIKIDLQKKPLEEILAALEILVEELPIFLEKYECNSSLTWKQWKKKYLFLATLTGLSIFIKIVIAMYDIHVESGESS